MFKNTSRILTGLAIAVATVFLHYDAVATQSSANVEHFTFKTAMTNTGVDPDAMGLVNGSITHQGNAYNQSLQVSLSKLTPNTAYQLTAFLGEDTNPVSVAGFVTDKKGMFRVTYSKKSQGKGTAKGTLLPYVLDPLCDVRELDIVDGNTNTLLQAVLASPDSGQYLVQRSMDNTGFIPAAVGNLRIKANSKTVQFSLQASGLTASSGYVLTINGNAASMNTSDTSGKLTLRALPQGAPGVLDIQTVALTDNTGTNVVLIAGGLGTPCSTSAQAGVNLGTAANFVVLAGSTVTSTGNTVLTGNLGVWAGTAVTGFQGIVPGGPGVVHGTIHAGDATAQIAQGDLTTAFNDAAGRTLAPVDVSNADLGGRTLAPGLYKSTGTLALTGTVTLDAQGDASGVWIFQIASSLNTAAGSQVILSGGAKASNVFWQVGSSATLGTTTAFKGTIMADQSISVATGATLEGRALARIAAVTMDVDTMTIPAP